MSHLEKFLAPVSDSHPCGEDISSRPDFIELDQIMRGKAETQFSEAVKPDWRLLLSRCEDLLATSKHLHVAVVFVLASLQTGGIRSAADALSLIAQWRVAGV